MIQLAYLSSTPVLLSPDDIAQILIVSRENNSRVGITGMLLYKDGNVLQFLEGEEVHVYRLMERISEDKRHRGVIRLYDKPIISRDFAEWTMGFCDLRAEGATYLEGYSEVLRTDFNLTAIQATAAQKLIRTFKASAQDKST